MTALILDPLTGARVPLPSPPKSAPIRAVDLTCRPLAVYVLRTARGEFVQAKVSRLPPADAEVHLRTYDADEAKAVAERLAITLPPTFEDRVEWHGLPGAPRKVLGEQSE